ncbi:hypothetical protein [Paenisporosarcina sp. OV554]|uniref:hypothetical protein n=1 Tax=Paenisporosarcina sp. OV554 TaxID=2135694 RepID=UPI000D3CB829|nr:hypothetical protein [Paenisporosarcina sp. OV554]PUB10120.1 hypothetical protein C8K15_12148 [Paenisporosarcina sp. OV554]
MVQTIPTSWLWDVIGFWYVGFIFWILLAASIVTFIIGVVKNSWKAILISVIIFLPNVLAIITMDFEYIMYLLLVWFIIQILMLRKIYRNNVELLI